MVITGLTRKTMQHFHSCGFEFIGYKKGEITSMLFQINDEVSRNGKFGNSAICLSIKKMRGLI